MNEIICINLGIVNCYLLKSKEDFILVDTGYPHQQVKLLNALDKAKVTVGHLKLIFLTHGDTDHTGNAAFIRNHYKTKIAMHIEDALMAETGDMNITRKVKADELSLLFKIVRALPESKKSNNFKSFKPDLYVEDHQDLSQFGFDGTILSLPGHTKGSIGLLSKAGDLICGDLFYNTIGFKFIDDRHTHRASVEKLKCFKINMVYPGHGKPFLFSSRIKN